MAKFHDDEGVKLMYNNDKKFETTSAGCSATTGMDFPDNQGARFGADGDLKIFHDGTHSYIRDDGTGDLIIRNGGDDSIRARTNGAVDLYHDNVLKAYTHDKGFVIQNNIRVSNNSGDSHYGVNTTNAYNLIHSNHSGASALLVEHSNDNHPNGIYIFFSDDNPDNHSQYFIAADDSTSTRFMVWSDGDVRNADNSYGATSDIKLKENIVDAGSQWNDVKAVKVRNFNYKTATASDKRLGVIAQEIETVSPGLVEDDPDLDNDSKPTGTTTKSVKYSILYMKAFKALQEAMAKIETLETKVAALEAG